MVEPEGILTKRSPVTPPEPEQPHRSETTPHIFYFSDPNRLLNMCGSFWILSDLWWTPRKRNFSSDTPA
jgi:hypothetical protein